MLRSDRSAGETRDGESRPAWPAGISIAAYLTDQIHVSATGYPPKRRLDWNGLSLRVRSESGLDVDRSSWHDPEIRIIAPRLVSLRDGSRTDSEAQRGRRRVQLDTPPGPAAMRARPD